MDMVAQCHQVEEEEEKEKEEKNNGLLWNRLLHRW
tara:strand:- start:878 stop:982 length:105 start_codon:yes stop_codon:yes gene_type:complete